MPMKPDELSGTLFYGDNLPVLREHFPDDSVDLIYLDPPFNSNATYNVLFRDESGRSAPSQIEAFNDTWHWGPDAQRAMDELVNLPGGGPVAELVLCLHRALGRNQLSAYLAMMTIRLVELNRILKPDGAIYLHCDQSASHVLRSVMDMIFGVDRFRSTIIWKRTSAHNDARYFGNVCDHILFYSGSPIRADQIRIDLDPEYVQRNYRHQDEHGQFMDDNLTAAEVRTGESGQPWRTFDPGARERHWAVPSTGRYAKWIEENVIPDYMKIKGVHERLEALDDADMLWWPESDEGFPRLKRYLESAPTQISANLWDDINPIGARARERLGYPTQKPEALLERVILASSDEGDLVLDPFCGCGTAMAVAERNGRRWAGIDITHLAVGLVEDRLRELGAEPTVIGAPADLSSARDLAQRDRFQFEAWAVTRLEGFRPNEKQTGDRGIDGRMRFVKAVGAKERNEYGLAVAQVKSGRAGASDMRDFTAALDQAGADLGVFITLEAPGRNSTVPSLAAEAGSVQIFDRRYPRIQIWTIEDCFAGRRPDLPLPAGRESRRML